MNNFLSNTIDYASLSAQSLTSVISNAKLDENFKLDWSTTSLSGFVFFGSAYSITQLAINKILQTYPINSLSSISASSLDFETSKKYFYSYSQFEQQILNGFSLSLTGTYNNDTFSIINIPRNIDNTVIELNDQIYINGLLSDAELYDSQNKNMLQNFVPDKFLEYDSENILTNLLNIWGQIFDEIMLYTSQFSSNLFSVDYANLNRPADNYNTLNLLGLNAYTNYLFSSLLDFLIVTDNKISYKAIQENVWSRILNNLIYIYKSKGTLESVKAFINCIGLNMDLVKINEYVNFTTPQYIDVIKKINIFELNFNSNSASYISATSNIFNLSASEWSLICNINLKEINATQNILATPNQYSLSIINDSTVDDYGQPLIYGHLSLTGHLSNGNMFILTSSTGNIFTNYPQTLIINKTSSSYEIYLNSIDLYNNIVSYSGITSITSSLTSISNNTSFFIGSNGVNLNNTYSGSIINFKALNTYLTPSQIYTFTNNINSLNLVKETFNTNILVNWELNEPLYSAYINNNYQYSVDTGNNIERVILDSSTGFTGGAVTGYSHFPDGNYYTNNTYSYVDQRFVSGLTKYSDKINIKNITYSNTKYLDVEIKPIDILNESFEYMMGAIDVIDYLSRNDFNTNYNKYLGLEALQNTFYKSSISLYGFFNLIDNIDKYAVGLFKLLSQFFPANSTLLYNGIVIESPVYDRNKYIIRNLNLANLSQLKDNISAYSIQQKSISSIEDIIFTYYEDASILNKMSSTADIYTYSITGNLDIVTDVPIDISLVSPFGDKIYDTNDSTSGIDNNINYLYNSDNIIMSYSLDNQIIYPIASMVSSAYGRLVGSGYNTIYLNYSFSGQSIYNIGYLDLLGDNIIGTKYTIYQNIGNNFPAFNIINADAGITSNSLMQTFYIDSYNGNNIIFSFNPSFGSLTSVKNKIIINDTQEQELDFNIIWNPDSRTCYNNYILKDTPTVFTYPVLYWNLNTGISAVTAMHSNYGSSITSSTLTTTADICFTTSASLTSINIVFKNYSPEIDDELTMVYYTSLTSPSMSLYKFKDSSNNILYQSSLDNYSYIKTKVYKNSSIAFSLIMDYVNNRILTYGNELIVNGGFETGNYNGWSISGSLTGTGYPYIYVDNNGPLSQSGNDFLACSTTAVLYQVIPVTPNGSYNLSFWTAMGLVYWSGTNENAKIVITQTISNVNTLSASDTGAYINYTLPNNEYWYVNTNFNLNISSTANYITIAFYFNAGPNYIRLDNISLKPYSYLPSASGYINFYTKTNKSFKINFNNNGI